MNDNSKEMRESIIIKTSIIGILANVFLSSFKAIVGLLANSIAIVLDAVNNFTDALSSIITIIGAKLGGKAPDKEHPFGHGRIEYLSAMTIAIIIIYAGATALIEAIKKIIHPQVPEYSYFTFIIVSVAIIVKIVLGTYVRKKGKEVNSDSLVNSGADALLDSIISLTTLIAAIIFVTTGISIEAWLGAIISIIIIKSGIGMLRETLSQILGERVESDIALAIKETVNSFEEVNGAYDLILSNYGPDTYLGSIHIEVLDTMTAHEIDILTRKIMHKVYKHHGVILSAVGIYALNTKDKASIAVRNKIDKMVHSYKSVIQMHGFYLNETDKILSFDIIIDFDDVNKEKTYNEIYEKVKKMYPEYKIIITMDMDISD